MKGELVSVSVSGPNPADLDIQANGEPLRGVSRFSFSADPDAVHVGIEFCGVALRLVDVPVSDAVVVLAGKRYRLVEIEGEGSGKAGGE